jgi:hypothetical protein
MPNINLRDKRNRDALVRADSVKQTAIVRYVDKDGAQPKLRHVLRATAEHSVEPLLADAGGDEAKLAALLVAGDPDVDLERIGMFLTDTSRVYVNAKGDIVYQIQQTEVVRDAFGVEKERRPRRQIDPNVESEIPITWTGRLIKKNDAIRRFVFSGKLQIVHVNGLTYDFLFGMAKELADADSMMLLGAGKSGKDPLIFRRGSTPYRGFLEGRIDGDKYILLLHLSKLELKRPAEAPVVVVADQAAAVPVAAPVSPPVAQLPVEDAPKKPTVAEVLHVTEKVLMPDVPVKDDIAETVVAAKAGKTRKTAAKVAETAGADGPAKPAAKPRARKPKPIDATKPDA